MDLMDQIVTDLTDLTCTIDESPKKTAAGAIGSGPRSKSGNSRAAAWAHRRSRSTSHLNLPSSLPLPDVAHKSESEDTSKGGNDSDDAERSLAKLSLQNTAAQRPMGSSSKSLKHSRTCSMPLTKHQSIVESDSLNELFSPTQQALRVQTPHSKRPRRRHKRMAVEISDSSILSERDVMLPCSSRTAAAAAAAASLMGQMGPPFHKTAPLVICTLSGPGSSHGSGGGPKKKIPSMVQDIRLELTGKRKRSHREKSSSSSTVVMASNSAPEASVLMSSDDQGLSTMDLMSMGMDALIGGSNRANLDYDDEMKSEASSLDSSSDSECQHPSCDEGQEGDDEHSDWVGDDWIDDMDVSERRRDLILKRLLDYGDSREIRAGKRKGFPNKPSFSIRTSANEQLSKFLQNTEQSELKLHPMRKEERVQLSHLASLYSLQMHCLQETDPSGLTCPVLTKTSNTTQMDNSAQEKPVVPSPILSESDTKRIKM